MKGSEVVLPQRVLELLGDSSVPLVETAAAVDEDNVWLRVMEANINGSANLVHEMSHPTCMITWEASAQNL